MGFDGASIDLVSLLMHLQVQGETWYGELLVVASLPHSGWLMLGGSGHDGWMPVRCIQVGFQHASSGASALVSQG